VTDESLRSQFTILLLYASVGGPAEKSRGLSVGDLITAINGTKMSSKSRTEAWNFMKKLGDGEVRVSVRSPILS